MNKTRSLCFLLLVFTLTAGCRGGAAGSGSGPVAGTPPAVTTSASLACSAANIHCVNATAGETQEYSTIQAAVDIARPGDTVLVYEGAYRGFTISESGTSSNRIVITAAGRSAMINRPNRNGEGVTIDDASYVTIEGFTVIGMPRAGIASHNASATSPMRGVIVRNNTVQNSGRTNIYMSQAANSLIEGNTASGSATSHGIYLANGGSDNTILRGNRCYNNFKNGIHFNGDLSVGGDGLHTGLIVENNVLYDNSDNGIDADGVQDSVFQNNLIYGNGRHALRVFRIDSAQGPKNLKIINNTLLVPSVGGWAIKLSQDLGGHTIFNNILLSANSSTGSISVPNTNLVSDNNAMVDRVSFNGEASIVTLAAWQLTGLDANSFTTTPESLFVSSASANYQLKAGAPAINSGRHFMNRTFAPPTDILGTARPRGAAYDMGAYESH
jgi:parallel beta-helix repeat protein